MAEGFIHTVPKNGMWVNTVEGGDAIASTFDTNRRRSRQAATSPRSAPRSTSSTTRTARSANVTRTAATPHTGPAEVTGPLCLISYWKDGPWVRNWFALRNRYQSHIGG
jgi:hypothetical protein